MNFSALQQYSSGIFKGLTGTQQQPSTQKLEDLINRSSGLGKAEKEVIFDYISNGEQRAKSRKEYITNIIIIFNSFFEYGFLRRSGSSSTGGGPGRSASYSDEWAESGDSSQLGKIVHYWEYLTVQFTDLDSIRYINFYYEDASTNREKALGWILLALNQKDELKNVIIELFSNIPILQLYSKEESYLWQNRKEILEALNFIETKNFYNPCPLLDNFIEFGKKKEAKKDQNKILQLLDIKSEQDQQEKNSDKQQLSRSEQNEHMSDIQHQQSTDKNFSCGRLAESIIRDMSSVDETFQRKMTQGSHHEQELEKIDSDNAMGAVARTMSRNIPAGSEGLTPYDSNNQNQRRLNIGDGRSSIGSVLEVFNYTPKYENQQNKEIFTEGSKMDQSRSANKRLNLFSKGDLLVQEQLTNPRDINYLLESQDRNNDSQQITGQYQTQGRDDTSGGNFHLSHRFFEYSCNITYCIQQYLEKDGRRKETLSQNSSGAPFKKLDSNEESIIRHNEEDNEIGKYNQQQNLEESRRVIDRIFTEGDILIPLHERKNFKMIYQDQYGKTYYQDILNSEMVYLNDFYDKMKIQEYTFQKKQLFMKQKDNFVNLY